MVDCHVVLKRRSRDWPDHATSSDSKVSGFDRPHVTEKISDSKVSGFGRKAHPERKVYGFKSIRIHVDGALQYGHRTRLVKGIDLDKRKSKARDQIPEVHSVSGYAFPGCGKHGLCKSHLVENEGSKQ